MSAAVAHLLAATAPGVAWVGIDSEVVARDAVGGVHLLDAQAALVWAHVDGRRTCVEVADAVAACVPNSTQQQRDTIVGEVLILLGTLSERGLVLLVDAGLAGQVSQES